LGFTKETASESTTNKEDRMMATWTAMYVDRKNEVWSCPITKTDRGYMLATANGARPITFYISEPDAAGGFISFHDYRLDSVPPGLRGCDFIQLRNQMYDALPWPQKPVEPPTVKQEPDGRLHIEPKSGTESSLQQLQRANWERTKAERTSREAARAAAQQTHVDSEKVAAARQINNDFAALRNRHGIKKD
jgi:hypothetical protein